MKRFIVIESSNEDFLKERFFIETKIRNHVSLPFTDDEYRCVMFNGITVELVNDGKYIIGKLS